MSKRNNGNGHLKIKVYNRQGKPVEMLVSRTASPEELIPVVHNIARCSSSTFGYVSTVKLNGQVIKAREEDLPTEILQNLLGLIGISNIPTSHIPSLLRGETVSPQFASV